VAKITAKEIGVIKNIDMDVYQLMNRKKLQQKI